MSALCQRPSCTSPRLPARREIVERRPWLRPSVSISAMLSFPSRFSIPNRPPRRVQARGLYGILSAVIVLASTLGRISAATRHWRDSARRSCVRRSARISASGTRLLSLAVAPTGSGSRSRKTFWRFRSPSFRRCVAYAIARHNLFDVDVYIQARGRLRDHDGHRAVGYLSTHTLISTVAARPLLVNEARRLSARVRDSLSFCSIRSVVCAAAVDTLFFRRANDYKGTVQSSQCDHVDAKWHQIMTQVVKPSGARCFVETVRSPCWTPPRKVARRSSSRTLPRRRRGSRNRSRSVTTIRWWAWMRSSPTLITRYDLEEDPQYEGVRAAASDTLSRLSASLVIPLVYHGQLSGLMTLGNKKSGHFYSREDIDLLTTMSDQAAVAIANA